MKIRIWQLGDHERRITPTPQVFENLVAKLREWGGRGDLDLVWDSLLKIEEFAADPPRLSEFEVETDDADVITTSTPAAAGLPRAVADVIAARFAVFPEEDLLNSDEWRHAIDQAMTNRNFRASMVEVAALAIAAIQAQDRRYS